MILFLSPVIGFFEDGVYNYTLTNKTTVILPHLSLVRLSPIMSQ